MTTGSYERSRTAGLLVLLALAAGCTSRYRNAVNPSAGQVEFDRDRYQCERESDFGDYSRIFKEWEKEARISRCMAARGWRRAD